MLAYAFPIFMGSFELCLSFPTSFFFFFNLIPVLRMFFLLLSNKNAVLLKVSLRYLFSQVTLSVVIQSSSSSSLLPNGCLFMPIYFFLIFGVLLFLYYCLSQASVFLIGAVSLGVRPNFGLDNFCAF